MNDGRQLADEGEEEWAVVAEPEQEQEDRQHCDTTPDRYWEARCGFVIKRIVRRRINHLCVKMKNESQEMRPKKIRNPTRMKK